MTHGMGKLQREILIALSENESHPSAQFGLTAHEIVEHMLDSPRRIRFLAMEHNPRTIRQALQALERRGFVVRTQYDAERWRRSSR